MIQVNYIAPINQLGYGQVGMNILTELSKKYRVNFWPIGNPDIKSQVDYDIVQCAINNTGKSPDLTAPCIKIWHQHDMAQFAGRGLKIGFPIFELDRFTENEKNSLRNCDIIFVCSEWARNVIHNQLPEYIGNVHIVPLGVDLHGIKGTQDNGPPTKFFNCGKWELRKGHDVIIDAFCKAFGPDDEVELYMMCDNVFLNSDQEWKQKYLSSKMGHRVTFIPRVGTHEEVIRIMSMMDVGVFPARAEGWNLELLEMMALGKKVITTNYSGHTQFCNEQNSHLIHIDSTEFANDGIWFNGQGKWAKFGPKQLDDLVDKMQLCHKAFTDDLNTLNVSGVQTGKLLTWENTINELSKYIEKIGE